jgi:hypothetical protein
MCEKGNPIVSESYLNESLAQRSDMIGRERPSTRKCIAKSCALVEAFHNPRSTTFRLSTRTVRRGREVIRVLGVEPGDPRAPSYTGSAGTGHTRR